jgi:hypothetical protein
MIVVVFTEDFATKKKGEQFECDSLLASHLVNVDKVAKYLEEKPQIEKKANNKTKKEE